MNIEIESIPALEDVITFYKTKNIEVKTPTKILRKEPFDDSIMELNTKLKNKKGISQPEIMNKLFSYEIIAKFLGINISKEKMIENIRKDRTINNGNHTIEKTEIRYGAKLPELLATTKNPERLLRTMISHEIWHLIEHETTIYDELITEGTATYAMTIYEGSPYNINKMLEKIKIQGVNNFNELKYEYCAVLVKKELRASTDLKLLLEKNIRTNIAAEYKKHVMIHAPKIFHAQMKNTPWMLRSNISKFLDLKNQIGFNIDDLEESNIYNSLASQDKNKIMQTYKMLQERIHIMK